jgi:hypothetical protein
MIYVVMMGFATLHPSYRVTMRLAVLHPSYATTMGLTALAPSYLIARMRGIAGVVGWVK